MVDELDLPLDQVNDLRHLARRLTWFQHYFKKETEEFGRKYNVAFTINDRRLSEAFLNWAGVFEYDRSDAALDRADFSIFAGGLMLRELLRANPAKAKAVGKVIECIPADPMAAICEFWPEGFLYTTLLPEHRSDYSQDRLQHERRAQPAYDGIEILGVVSRERR